MDSLAAKNLAACFGSLKALKRATADELQVVHPFIALMTFRGDLEAFTETSGSLGPA